MGSYFTRPLTTAEIYESLVDKSASARQSVLSKCSDEQLTELAILAINDSILFNNIICLGRVFPYDYEIFLQLCLSNNKARVSKWAKKVPASLIDKIILNYMNKITDPVLAVLLTYSSLDKEIISNELVLNSRLSIREFDKFELYDYTLHNLLVDDSVDRLKPIIYNITNRVRCLELAIDYHAINCAKLLIDHGSITKEKLYELVIQSDNNVLFDHLVTSVITEDGPTVFALAVKMGNTHMAKVLSRYVP